MKWKNEIPNKTEFMKINSFNFIECEKFHSELVHEQNAGKIRVAREEGGKYRVHFLLISDSDEFLLRWVFVRKFVIRTPTLQIL